jgi:alkylated DNA repair dioxygenase AlkB
MLIGMQLGLFDSGPSELLDLREARRHELAAGAWLLYLPGWLRGHAALFDELDRSVPWKRGRRNMYDRVVEVPRATCFGPIHHPLVDEMQRALELHLGLPLPHVSAALYETGDDSVAWHGDRMADARESHVVTVSLGAPRRFLLRPGPETDDPRGTRAFALGWGDLVVMGGSCQRTYEHAVPKVKRAQGPRLVVMFRDIYDPG